MEENLKVDKDFKEAFNLGYELAMELNLKLPMFDDVNLGNTRMGIIQSGMTQYLNEISQVKVSKNIQSLGIDENLKMRPKSDKEKGKGGGLKQSL